MSSERTDAYDRYIPLLDEFASLDRADSRRVRVRDDLVRAFRPVAHNVALRFARRGEPVEDLEQVALVGLVQALDRFDPARGSDFLSYAIPTMMGEVRRYFRDVAWTVRTPRSIKDNYVALGTATTTLSQRLGRAPTIQELAEHLGMGVEQVREAYAASTSYRPTSLDRALDGTSDAGGSDDGAHLVDLLGVVDDDLDQVDTRAMVGALVARLPEREQALLRMRFVQEKTQREIGAELCISQMHVSRLLTQTLALLRDRLHRDGCDSDVLAA